MTPFQLHVAKWQNCQACELCTQRTNIVLCRTGMLGDPRRNGGMPCDVLFVGEAPGDSEDATAQPFVGPAGHELDGWISRVEWGELRLAYTNLVCCFPREAKETEDHRPPDIAIQECSERLVEFVTQIAKPRLIIYVGSTATDWGPQFLKVPYVSIIHPSAVLQNPVVKQGLMIQRALVTMAGAVNKLRSQNA